MAKNENFKDRDIVFIGDIWELDTLASFCGSQDPLELDVFRKNMREYSDMMLIAYIVATYSRNTAISWILYTKYKMNYSQIGRHLNISNVAVAQSINNIKDKIEKMNSDSIDDVLEESRLIFDKNSSNKKELSDNDFLLDVLEEQLKIEGLSKEDEKKLKKIKKSLENTPKS